MAGWSVLEQQDPGRRRPPGWLHGAAGDICRQGLLGLDVGLAVGGPLEAPWLCLSGGEGQLLCQEAQPYALRRG